MVERTVVTDEAKDHAKFRVFLKFGLCCLTCWPIVIQYDVISHWSI